MAEALVDGLEVVQVEVQQRELGLGGIGLLDGVAKQLGEEGAIRKAGKRVAIEEEISLLFGRVAVGDVAVRAATAEKRALLVVDRPTDMLDPALRPVARDDAKLE